MTRAYGLPLILLGALLILVPVGAHTAMSLRDKERIAAFYERYPNNATLPIELRPTDFSGYDWACFGIGVAFAFVGISRTGNYSKGKPDSLPSEV